MVALDSPSKGFMGVGTFHPGPSLPRASCGQFGAGSPFHYLSRMKTAPRSPAELRDTLAAIFPSLPRAFASSGESVFADAGPTCHSVLREFADYFAKDLSHFSDRQLRRFADLVARSVSVPGPLERAFDTCFLEHTRRLGVESRLRPFLSTSMNEGQ